MFFEGEHENIETGTKKGAVFRGSLEKVTALEGGDLTQPALKEAADGYKNRRYGFTHNRRRKEFAKTIRILIAVICIFPG